MSSELTVPARGRGFAWLPVLLCILVAAGLFAPAPAHAQEPVEDAALAQHLVRHGVVGVIAVLDPANGRLRTSDARRAAVRLRPASTFKIASALIALETGVVKDAHGDVFKYDGKPFLVPACNADQTLASALPRSCVPVFARIGRMIGDARLGAGLQSFGYGNAAASGDYPYWLAGDLRISPLEQVGFIDRLRRGTLPLRAEVMRTVTDIIEISRDDGFVLRGKTGWLPRPEPGVGWLVGWAEKAGAVRVFAVALEMKGVDPAKRLAVALSVLEAEGLAPANSR